VRKASADPKEPLFDPDGKLNYAALSSAAVAALQAEVSSSKPGEPQLVLSVLRLLELAADDSGLREGAMQGVAGVLGQALAADPVAFAARWVRWLDEWQLCGLAGSMFLVPAMVVMWKHTCYYD
jgi:hypothetical protein